MELLIFVSFIFLALWSILGFGKLFETLFFDGSVQIGIGLTENKRMVKNEVVGVGYYNAWTYLKPFSKMIQNPPSVSVS